MDGLLVALLVVALYTWLLCGVVTGMIAASRGREGYTWFILGLLFGVFGIILVALLPSVSTGAVLPVKNYDQKKWQFLKDVDPEIAEVAGRVAVLGSNFEDKLAEMYLTLSDKAYLGPVERFLAARATKELQRVGEVLPDVDQETAVACLREMESHSETLRKNDQKDPWNFFRKAIKIEPYIGKEFSGGGIKVTYEDGSVIMKSGDFFQRYDRDPKAMGLRPIPKLSNVRAPDV